MAEKKHKLGLELPKNFKCCVGIQISIDGERVNALGLYPLNKDGRRIEDLEKLDFEFDVYELEVRNIEEIAYLMNEETFGKFCEIWRMYHEKQ